MRGEQGPKGRTGVAVADDDAVAIAGDRGNAVHLHAVELGQVRRGARAWGLRGRWRLGGRGGRAGDGGIGAGRIMCAPVVSDMAIGLVSVRVSVCVRVVGGVGVEGVRRVWKRLGLVHGTAFGRIGRDGVRVYAHELFDGPDGGSNGPRRRTVGGGPRSGPRESSRAGAGRRSLVALPSHAKQKEAPTRASKSPTACMNVLHAVASRPLPPF
jgi:hypothetical protein